MIFSTVHELGATVVRPGVDRLTASNAKVFKDDIAALIESGVSELVIDFTDVSFMDSSGLGALVGVLKKVGNRGDLVVCGLSAAVEQMFRICRMDRVFNIYQDVQASVQALSERA